MNTDLVAIWSGGLDSTGMIFLLLEKFSCKVHPLFVNRHQKNYAYEKKAIEYYTRLFLESYSGRFNTPLEVCVEIPPAEFDVYDDNVKYALRNSDIINQGVRYAMSLELGTVLIGTFDSEDLYGDGSDEYLTSKTLEVRTGIKNKNFEVRSPFAYCKFPQSKMELIKICHDLHFDLYDTRSCYGSNVKHCGMCQACENRNNAFRESAIEDKTHYDQTPNDISRSRPEKSGTV